MDGLSLEWKQITPLINGCKVQSIYFGGGTPWLMGADNIKKILALVNETIDFSTEAVEITLEANPENVTQEGMQAYADAGINRVSIGIQSLDQELLKKLSRQHTAEKAIEAVYMAQDCGIDNISVDLMYDLPNQTLSTWESTLKKARELPITHLSLYNLTIEPHTVFYKHKNKLLKQIPDPSASLLMYEMAVELLEEGKLHQYEISAFARDKKHSIHNTGYWLARPFIGLGPSAFSDWDGARFQNVANLSRYCKALKEGVRPVDFYEKLDKQSRNRELLTIQMRLLEGVNLESFESRHSKIEADTLATLNNLEKEGYLSLSNGLAKLTKQGILFYDTVASELV